MITARYEDHMGTDLTVVNAARVSFGKRAIWKDPVNKIMRDADRDLVKFLARGCTTGDWGELLGMLRGNLTQHETHDLMVYLRKMPDHWTPFAHCQITLVERVPIFVARQRFKHQVGFVYNEISRRYVDDTPEFYYPTEWRSRPAGSVKQGSGGGHPQSKHYSQLYGEFINHAELIYCDMIADGIAPEQARMVLPQSMMTEYYVTGSLYAWANAYNQRSDSHAQKEIQDLAAMWKDEIKPLFPVSWAALTNGDY